MKSNSPINNKRKIALVALITIGIIGTSCGATPESETANITPPVADAPADPSNPAAVTENFYTNCANGTLGAPGQIISTADGELCRMEIISSLMGGTSYTTGLSCSWSFDIYDLFGIDTNDYAVVQIYSTGVVNVKPNDKVVIQTSSTKLVFVQSYGYYTVYYSAVPSGTSFKTMTDNNYYEFKIGYKYNTDDGCSTGVSIPSAQIKLLRCQNASGQTFKCP